MRNRMTSGVVCGVRLHLASHLVGSSFTGLYAHPGYTVCTHPRARLPHGRSTSSLPGLLPHPVPPMRVDPATSLLPHTHEHPPPSRQPTMFACLSAGESPGLKVSVVPYGPCCQTARRHARTYAQEAASSTEGGPFNLPDHRHAGERGDRPPCQRARRCTGRSVCPSAHRPQNAEPHRPAHRSAHQRATTPARTPAISSATSPVHITAHKHAPRHAHRTARRTGSRITHHPPRLMARL